MLKYLFTLLLTLLIFTGCVPKQEAVQTFFQTDSATSIKKDYAYIIKHIQILKTKIDKRNSKAYNKEYTQEIENLLQNYSSEFHLDFRGKTLDNYKEYLQIAFSKDVIENRNDFLIMGLYYHIYDAYDIEDGHQITTFTYDAQKLEKLYKNLQILKWKIKVNRDINSNYLFLTWQNNWQVELEQKIKAGEKPSWQDLQNLKYIKNGQEKILGYSNFSYEVLLTQMINRVENSLETLGVEPEEIALEAIKSIFIFL